MKKNKKLNYLLIAILSLILVLLITFLIFISTNDDIKNEKNYTSLTLTGVGNYINGEDFLLDNQISIDANLPSKYYRPNVSRFFVDKSILKTRANQMGFQNENANLFNETYIWSKTKNLNSESLKLNEKIRELEFSYEKGINEEQLSDDEIYNYVKDYFGLKIIDAKIQKKNESGGNTKTLYYTAVFGDKEIYFDSDENIFASFVVVSGKIIGGFITLIQSDLYEAGELRPVKSINPENVNDLNYSVIFEGIDKSNATDYSSGPPIGKNTRVVLNSYKDTFYVYIDAKETYILPALELTGEYLDNNNNKGPFKMIAINQAKP